MIISLQNEKCMIFFSSSSESQYKGNYGCLSEWEIFYMRSGIKLLCLCSHRGELRLQMLKDETWAQKGIRSGRITGGNMSKLVLSNFQFSNADISSNMYLPVISQFFSQQSNHISSDICFSKKLRWPDENDIGGGILAEWEKINLTGLSKKNRPQVP